MQSTIEKVARKAGTSKASVSRYFNPSERNFLSLELQEKIHKAAGDEAYKPREYHPKKISKRKTYALGIMVPFSEDIAESPYHRQLFRGIIAAVKESSYDLKLLPVRDEDYSNIRRLLQKHLVDGLLVLTWRSHPNLINLVQVCSTPFPIMLFNDYDSAVQVHFAYCDVFAGMEMAVYHLVEKGRERIAFLKGPSINRHGTEEHPICTESLDTRDKFEGFKKGMRASLLEIKDIWIKECASYAKREGYEKVKEILTQQELPDAIICSNDELAMGALDFLKERNIRCPEDIAVIGFDGISEGAFTNPPLTSMKQPLRQMGYEGGKRLIDIAEGREMGLCHLRFQPTLITRTSA